MKRIENPQILNKIFEILQKEIGVDIDSNQPVFCGDIKCDDCAFVSKCITGKKMKINWLQRNWQDVTKRAKIYNLILEIIAVDKTGVIKSCKDMPCMSKTCKFFGFDSNSHFYCDTMTKAWLQEEI